MEDPVHIFSRLQPRMLGAAYRMLGSLAEAEDVVQDVWTRWHDADVARIENAEAWLVTTTTHRAVDRLRQARVEREKYAGIWLPEPVLTDGPATPEQLQEASSDLSIAFLTVLERLAPDARAAFLLREVFDVDYPEIADLLGKTETACRQIVHRAKRQLREARPRYAVSEAAHRRLMRRFVEAMSGGDFAALKDLLAESAELVGDGGGIVTSFPEPMVGGRRIAQLFYAATLGSGRDMRVELASINGRWGVLRYLDGELESAQSYDTDGEKVLRIYVQRNPHKLARIAARQLVSLE
ncbi:RNA polymerase sigma-70 factor [Dokdonella sp.]|uniref:RNA polymerase sigma-70 factor n=1 Tax=Dokdonella sp. TaxID=2291710 RepID=UPI001B099980|nr:RNA polymerase sigma-70 factor [Dokdonella sp.]MBO9661665.1 RNA polymerase sigma-70 factor [Dokdonella sp.]